MGQEYFDYQEYKRELERQRMLESYSRQQEYDEDVNHIEELREELRF